MTEFLIRDRTNVQVMMSMLANWLNFQGCQLMRFTIWFSACLAARLRADTVQ